MGKFWIIILLLFVSCRGPHLPYSEVVNAQYSKDLLPDIGYKNDLLKYDNSNFPMPGSGYSRTITNISDMKSIMDMDMLFFYKSQLGIDPRWQVLHADQAPVYLWTSSEPNVHYSNVLPQPLS